MNEELKQVENLLNNIDNLNDIDKKMLRRMIVPYYINTSDEYMALYNGLDENKLRQLIDLVEIKTISEEFIKKINNKRVLIVPYNHYNSMLYYGIFKNEEATNCAITTETFYKDLRSLDITTILRNLSTANQKKKFISNCLIYKEDIILEELSLPNTEIIKYITDEQIIGIMKKQNDSDIVLKLYAKLNNENKNILYRSDWFREKVDINNPFSKYCIIRTAPDEVVMELVDSSSLNTFLDFFTETGRVIFLKVILDKTVSKDFNDEFLFNKLMIILLSISEKKIIELGRYRDKLIDLINNLDDNLFITYYFAKYRVSKFSDPKIKGIMFNKVKSILESNDIEIEQLSPNIINSNDNTILDLIIHNISKDNLLMLSIRNEYIHDYVMNLLKVTPNYFENVKVSDNQKYSMPKIEEEQIVSLLNKYIGISTYLTDDQLDIYYIPFYIKYDSKIREYYINEVSNNYNRLTSLNDLNLFDENMTDNILSNIDITKLIDLILYKSFKLDKDITQILRKNMDNRIYELVAFINDNENTDYISISNRAHIFLRIISENKIDGFTNLINNKEILCHILLNVHGSTYDVVLNRLIKLYNNDIEIPNMTLTPMIFDEKKELYFFENLSFEALVNLTCAECRYSDQNSKNFKKYMAFITNKIDQDINILFSINVITKLEELLNYLPQNYSLTIRDHIDSKYNLLKNKYNNLSKYINSYTEKANYICSVENNLINDSNYNYILSLLSKNKSLFNSMDFRLLNGDIMKMGNYFINKTSRYPIVSSKLLKIYDSDISKYNIVVALSNKMRKENNDIIYDQKIEMIIDFLLDKDIVVDSIIDNSVLSNIENYILDQCINKGNHFTNLNIHDYINEKNSKLDNEILNSSDVNKLKNLLYYRYFGLNNIEVENFLFSYAFNWNSVANLCEIDLPSQYIDDINRVKNINDIQKLHNITNSLSQYTISDFMVIKSIMIDTYNKSICKDISTSNRGIKKVINIGDKQIEVEELIDNVGIFVHSTDAYGSMPLINNDYYDSWNYNPNTKNHGICTCYITNSNYGTAAVKNKGVMFGFTDIQSNSIPLIAPYDLMTINDGYNIKSIRRPFFGNLKTISEYTRHTHNEASFERLISAQDEIFDLRQPNLIIIFEDMPLEVKENSIKAYKDFIVHGQKIKIKYFDRVKNAKREAYKLDQLINEYENNFDLDLLKNIINLYESNICSCDYIGTGRQESLNLFDQHELFQTNKMKQLLKNTIEYIKGQDDFNIKNNMINKLYAILNEEQFKFDIIQHENTNRVHKFDLYDSKLKEEVEGLVAMSKNDINKSLKSK